MRWRTEILHSESGALGIAVSANRNPSATSHPPMSPETFMPDLRLASSAMKSWASR